VIFLRDLLATRAAVEPDVTSFLARCVYEELWHGEAFSRFLGEAGFELAPTASTSSPKGSNVRVPLGGDDGGQARASP
jgi:hypothetical protein